MKLSWVGDVPPQFWRHALLIVAVTSAGDFCLIEDLNIRDVVTPVNVKDGVEKVLMEALIVDGGSRLPMTEPYNRAGRV